MQRSFWLQGMFSDINGYIRTCVSSQRSKRSPVKPSGLLQPLHIPRGPWDSVSFFFFFFFFFFFGFRGIVHPPSADEGTERTWMKVPNEPGLSPNNGLEHVSLSDQSMASNPRKGQIPIFARATVVVRYCDPDCPTIIGSVVTLYP